MTLDAQILNRLSQCSPDFTPSDQWQHVVSELKRSGRVYVISHCKEINKPGYGVGPWVWFADGFILYGDSESGSDEGVLG